LVSVASATNGLAKAVLTFADWPEPETMAMEVGVAAPTVTELRCRWRWSGRSR
jgi:hypothetical protein